MKSLRQPLCLPVVFNPDTIDWESSAITIANSLAIAPLMYDLFGRIKVFLVALIFMILYNNYEIQQVC